MIKKSLKIAFRNALKNKYISLLNIIGLGVGLACTILLFSWVAYELSHDDYIKDRENIYRVVIKGEFNNRMQRSSSNPPGIGPYAKNDLPEVFAYNRILTFNDNLLRTNDNQHFRDDGYAADPNFFRFFSMDLLLGDLSTCLDSKEKVVLSESLSNKIFGKENPLGKKVTIGDWEQTVSAVVKDVPSNSHLQFSFVLPNLRLGDWFRRQEWGGDNCATYLKLNKNADLNKISSAITNEANSRDQLWKSLNVDFNLQELNDIYFDNDFLFNFSNSGNKKNIYLFSSIAFLILIIACINFTNLFISYSLKRRKSTGIKITNGARKRIIIKEFFIEVFMYVLISFVVSLILIKFIHPYFKILAGKDIPLHFWSIRFMVISLGMIGITLLLSGIFPGVFLTRLKSAQVMKSNISDFSKRMGLQKSLVIFQFIIACSLIVSFTFIMKQINFIKSKELGFDKENVLYIPTSGKLRDLEKIRTLKQELLKNPTIKGIAYRGGELTKWANGFPLSKNKKLQKPHSHEHIFIGKDYFDLMDIEFIEGENVFELAFDSKNYCILNERSVQLLNLDPPYIDKVVYSSLNNQPYIIKGVVENVNTKALTRSVDPCFYVSPKWLRDDGIILFKVHNNYDEAITAIRSYWKKILPGFPFEYKFLDDTYDSLYKSVENTRKLLTYFSCIAIFLTSLGLLAMILYITENRTKEIGIRKANGANMREILTMLNKDIVQWVVIAFIIACPIAWYTMNKWLENFAYRTEISWWIFALAGVITMGIALLTVSFQSWKAATRNPVESLRDE